MARVPSRSAVPFALVCVAMAMIIPVYGRILPPVWHLSFMAASLLLIAFATYFHDRSRARTGPMAVNPTGPKLRLPRRER